MTHTYPLHLSYRKCPHCQHIIECRQDFRYQMGRYEREITCPKCKKTFIDIKKGDEPLGPLFGEAPKPEFDWR